MRCTINVCTPAASPSREKQFPSGRDKIPLYHQHALSLPTQHRALTCPAWTWTSAARPSLCQTCCAARGAALAAPPCCEQVHNYGDTRFQDMIMVLQRECDPEEHTGPHWQTGTWWCENATCSFFLVGNLSTLIPSSDL
eukprot:scaffold88090_cov21-Tisochrysis_lutea.AAC.1